MNIFNLTPYAFPFTVSTGLLCDLNSSVVEIVVKDMCLLTVNILYNVLGAPFHTYLCHIFKEDIVENHKSVPSSFCLSTKDDDCDLPSLYWIPKLHKDPCK